MLAGVAVYANSFAGVFQFDDSKWIERNDAIQQLWPPDGWLRVGRRPVVNLTLALNYAAGQLNTWGYHLVNLIVHLLSGLTLFGILRRTPLWSDRADADSRSSVAAALAIALIWLVHPLQTQSVTYIIQRGESLMGLFYLLTLYCVIRGAQSATRSTRWYVAAVLACGLGMGSKAVCVTAPLVVLLYDRTFLSKSWTGLRQRWGLYVGLAATWCVVWLCGVARGVLSTTAKDATAGFSVKSVTSLEYALSQPGVLLHYLKLCFWPATQCLDYGWPVAQTIADKLVPGLVIVLLLAGTLWGLLRGSKLGFAGAWFFLILAPTSSIVPIRDLAYEHRMYLPLASVVAVTVVGARWVLARMDLGLFARPTAVALLALVTVALGARTVARNRDYHSLEGMWAGIVTQRPNNPRAHYNYAHELADQGEIDRGIEHYRRALEISPNLLMAHNNLGRILSQRGQSSEALHHFREALRVREDFAPAQHNLARELALAGRANQAIPHYERALELNPNDAEGHHNYAHALQTVGRLAEAEQHYRQAIQLKPAFTLAYINLGHLLTQQGKLADAVQQFQQAIALQPGNADTHYALALALVKMNRPAQAVAPLRQALRLNLNHTAARKLLQSVQGPR
ncbi:MAG: tetratricopeptide repeat protein [Phycisphaerae bacterium]